MRTSVRAARDDPVQLRLGQPARAALFVHFAAAKAALRMISQSIAREYEPKGLDVAHILIDGTINGER
jgi:NAD(P)-dependent dehydrogenase (short-subunit alcohol dehydrogenase family)